MFSHPLFFLASSPRFAGNRPVLVRIPVLVELLLFHFFLRGFQHGLDFRQPSFFEFEHPLDVLYDVFGIDSELSFAAGAGRPEFHGLVFHSFGLSGLIIFGKHEGQILAVPVHVNFLAFNVDYFKKRNKYYKKNFEIL